MEINKKDVYFVAVKIFFEDDGKLLILKDNFGDWDLPGGRIKADEFDVPLEKIIERKLKEELGSDMQYSIGKPIVFMRHEWVEASEGHPTVRIFAVGSDGSINKGDIHLSERHSEFKWVSIADFKPEDYFTGGWLWGIQEYLAIKRVG